MVRSSFGVQSVFIYHRNGECTFIKSRMASLIADNFLCGMYGDNWDKEWSILRGVDENGQELIIYKDGRLVDYIVVEPRKG